MRYDIISLLANVITAYAIFRFMPLFSLELSKTVSKTLLTYLVFITITSLRYYIFDIILIRIISNIFGILLITRLYKGIRLKKILAAAIIYLINICVKSIIIYILLNNLGTSYFLVSIFDCISSLLILLIVVFLENYIIIKKHIFTSGTSMLLCTILVPVISICLIILYVFTHTKHTILFIVEVSVLLIINLIIFCLYNAIQDHYKQKSINENLQFQLAIYTRQLEIETKSYSNVMSLRHDLKHHIGELKYLAITNDTSSDIINYLSNMEQSLLNSSEFLSTGNTEIDSTLNFLLQKAKKVLINPEISVKIPENLNIHLFEINVILSNLLENSISAAMQSAQKYLKLDIYFQNGLLYIRLKNSFDGVIKSSNNKLLTRKKDTAVHGIGLNNVTKIVEESNGAIDINWTDHMFRIDIMLYISGE